MPIIINIFVISRIEIVVIAVIIIIIEFIKSYTQIYEKRDHWETFKDKL